MTVLSLNEFNGIVESLNVPKLPPGMASEARNVVLRRKTLDDLPSPKDTGTNLPGSGRRTLFRYRYKTDAGVTAQVWLSFAARVHVVSAPLADDSHDRVYWTQNGEYPRMADSAYVLNEDDSTQGTDYPERSYGLGVPAPIASPTPSLQGELDEDDRVQDTAYVYTLVDRFGAEGPPSPASRVVQRNDASLVHVQLPTLPPPEATQDEGESNTDFRERRALVNRFRTLYARGALGTGGKVRLYRANAGTDTAVYQFVDEVPLPFIDPIVDNHASFALGEALPSFDWFAPPDTNDTLYPDGPLINLTALPGGILAGSSGRGIFFSVPGLPHAWPPDWKITVDEDVVALRAVSSGLAVLTQGRPYLISGTHPQNMAAERIEFPQACLSEEAVVDMGGWIIYAAPDGLAKLEGVKGELLTAPFNTPKQWRARYKGGRLKGYFWEDNAVFLPTAAADGDGFIVDPRVPGTVRLTETCHTGFADPNDGTLYIVKGADILTFGDGTARTADGLWTSHWTAMPSRPAMTHVYVELEELVAGALTLTVLAEGYADVPITIQLTANSSPDGFLSEITYPDSDGSTVTLTDSVNAASQFVRAAPGGWPPFVIPFPPRRASRWRISMVPRGLTVRSVHVCGSRQEAMRLVG